MDLIRALMLKLEALPVDGHSIFAIGPSDEELAVDGASFDQIDYHLGLLRKQGFLDCPGEPMLSGKFPFRGLTWAGHDFLDSIRDDDVWRKTKTHAEEVFQAAWLRPRHEAVGRCLPTHGPDGPLRSNSSWSQNPATRQQTIASAGPIVTARDIHTRA